MGDATSFVGRSDDPAREAAPPPHAEIAELTTTAVSRISPIDTSDTATDVESVDQMDDSQNETENLISPHDGVSHSTHEKDDLALTVTTGYPTPPSSFSDDLSDPFVSAEQNSDSLEVLQIPGLGLVIGGGALATAALDFAKDGQANNLDPLVQHLQDEGVPSGAARDYVTAFKKGRAIVAVNVTPGKLDEQAVEDICERNGAENGALYDAPRY